MALMLGIESSCDETAAAVVENGRTVRIGPLDLVAAKYGTEVQAATELALTKLDVLSELDEIPLCVGYRLNGEVLTEMPFPSAFAAFRNRPVSQTYGRIGSHQSLIQVSSISIV